MLAFRCRDCGDTRWSLLGSRKSAEEQGPCQLCGGEMTRERRTPSVSATAEQLERREAPQGSPAAT